MLKKANIWMIVFVLALLSLTACGGGETEMPAEPEEPTQVAPTDTQVQPEPTEEETEESAEAKAAVDAAQLYQSNCAGCHGADRSGQSGPALLPDRLTQEASYYVDVITNGSGGMPSFGNRLSDEEISALVEFIRSEP